mgnify:CR=1 FL=1
MTIHVVQPGETVASIAAGYGVDPVRLATDNSVDRGQLAVGQTLVIRFPRRVHAVQPGETLYSISQSYGVSLRQLWRNNWSLGGNTALQPGQQLVNWGRGRSFSVMRRISSLASSTMVRSAAKLVSST